MSYPEELKYTSSHEWIKVKGDKGVVGITYFAQKELGDIVFVELPETGRQYKAKNPCCVVESVKTASDIYCPVSGTITDVNQNLNSNPELINDDCYGKGWIFEIAISDPSELDKLLSAEDYKNQYTK